MRSATERRSTTPFSIIQVRVTLTGGELTRRRDRRAERRRRPHPGDQRARRADPARGGAAGRQREVDVVTGATYTSRSYRKSLQAAIDEAAARVAGGLHRVETSWGSRSGSTSATTASTRRRSTAPSPGCAASTPRSAPTAPTSEVSRLTRARSRSRDAAPEVRAVLARCAALRARTGGCFDVRAPRRARPVGLREGLGGRGAASMLVGGGRAEPLRPRRRRRPRARRARAGPAVARRHPAPPPARPRRRRAARARPRGRDLGRLRARRAHRRPAHRRAAAGRAVGHRRSGPTSAPPTPMRRRPSRWASTARRGRRRSATTRR